MRRKCPECGADVDQAVNSKAMPNCGVCGAAINSRSGNVVAQYDAVPASHAETLEPNWTPPPPIGTGTGDNKSAAPSPGRLQLRCPHCKTPVEISSGDSLQDLTCESCGSRFSLLGDDEKTVTYHGFESKTVGHFKIIEQLGAGGFGSVWKANDTELDRIVAVKIPRRTLDGKEREFFLREARAAAQLSHPGIVGVHEVGTDGETVFIVSDYVQGYTLADRLSDDHYAPREAADLCRRIADALHHAHEAGVIHRDLKPSNIMIDAAGSPRVMDFGLAKREAGEVTMTMHGKVMGTPAYMSPEQARGESHQADRRTDVYSLGVILFEAMTGERPFRGNTRMLIHHCLHDDPPSPRRYNNNVPRDLETICLKCLEKDPDRRYATAEELGRELQRFLEGKPILARPTTRVYKAWKWVRRHPGTSVSALVALLAIVVGFAAVSWQLGETRVARDDEYTQRVAAEEARDAERDAKRKETESRKVVEQERDRAEASEYLHKIALTQVAIEETNFLRARQLLTNAQQKRRHWEWRYLHGIANPHHVSGSGRSGPERRTAAFSPGGRYFVWQTNSRGPSGKPTARMTQFLDADTFAKKRSLRSKSLTVTDVVFGPNDRLACLVTRKRGILYDVQRGRKLRGVPVHPYHLQQAAWSRDGRSIVLLIDRRKKLPGDAEKLLNRAVLGARSTDWELRVLDGSTRKTKLSKILDDVLPESMQLSPSGLDVALVDARGIVSIRNVRNGELRKRFAVPTKESRGLARADAGFLRMMAGGVLYIGHGPVCAAWSPDEQQIATGGDDGLVRLWNPRTGEQRGVLRGHRGDVLSVAYRPDGKQLATAGTDRFVRVWDARTRQLLRTFRGHDEPVQTVSYAPDGRRLVSVDLTGNIRVWDATRNPGSITCPPTRGIVEDLAFLPDSGTLAMMISPPFLENSAGHRIQLVDINSGRKRTIVHDSSMSLGRGAASADGRFLVIAGTERNYDRKTRRTKSDARILVWDARTERTQKPLTVPNMKLRQVALHPDNRRIAVAGLAQQSIRAPGGQADLHGVVCICDLRTGKVIRRWSSHPGRLGVTSVAWNHDGSLLATGGGDRAIHVWNAETGRRLATCTGHRGSVLDLRFHPHDGSLVSASNDRTMIRWNPKTGTRRRTFRGHSGTVTSIALTRDGRRLASTGSDETVRIWDVESGELVLTLRGHTHQTRAVAFSPDGHLLASGGVDGVARVWDARPVTKESRANRRANFPRYADNWHEQQFLESQSSEDWFAAAFHLNRMSAARKKNPDWWLHRAHMLAGSGRWVEAQAAIDRFRKIAEPNETGRISHLQALTALARNDQRAYRSACRAIVSRLTKDAALTEWNRAAVTCLLAPRALDDYRKLLDGMTNVPFHPDLHVRFRAGLQFRSGMLDAALKLLGVKSPAGSRPSPWMSVFRALIYARKNQAVRAKKELARARELYRTQSAQGLWRPPKTDWMTRFSLERLLTEAENSVSKSAGRRSPVRAARPSAKPR